MVERAFWREAGEAGLLGVSVPEAYGGPGGDFRHDVVVAETIIRKGVEGFAAGLHNVIITPYIQATAPRGRSKMAAEAGLGRAGRGDRDERARRRLRPAVRAHHCAPRRQWLPDQRRQDLHLQRPDRRPDRRRRQDRPGRGRKGVSLLVVETDEVEGFRRGRKLDKVGLDAQDTSELFFDDVWVPADNLLGLEEGRGFYQLMAELPRERLLIALGSAVGWSGRSRRRSPM